MRPLKTIVTSLTLLLTLSFAHSATAQHYVPIDGVVDSTLVLHKLGADSAYWVNASLTVTEGGVLCVEAGAEVFFGQSAFLRVDGGSLVMDGRKDDLIHLRCYEFSHDWAGVQLKNVEEEGMVRLSHVEVMGALTALNATACDSVLIRNCLFNNYYAGKGIELVDCSNFLIDSCLFYQCISGVELKAKSKDSENNRITHCVFDQGQINVEVSNVGYGCKCRNNVISDNCFQDAATAISFESIGGLSDKNAKNFILNNLISSSLPEGSGNYSSFGIKAAMDTLVIRNNVFWGNDEAVTMLRVCHLVFEHNTFYDNGLVFTNLLSAGSVTFVGNTISEAKRRIVSYPSGKSKMNGNNFLHYKRDAILFANVSLEDIDMRGNHWDTDQTAVIDAVILDKNDSPALGEILYDGFLPECDTTVPVSPPFMVKKQFVNGSWLISWEKNPESDIDHYVLFYGNFGNYKFAHHIDSIFGNSYSVSSQQAENVAVMACDGAYNPDVYASTHQSAYAFASYYPYAGRDGNLCAPEAGFVIDSANIPYVHNGFVWRTSGSGLFSDSLALRPTYYPSDDDFDAGEVTLTLRAVSNGVVKTDELRLHLFKELKVNAGEDYYCGLNRPILLDQAQVEHCDSIQWMSLGDGRFEDSLAVNTVYFTGNGDRQRRYVELVLKAWSFCGMAEDTIRFDLYEEFSLEGKVWSRQARLGETHVVAAGLNDGNPFFSGFYRTVADAEGRFKFESLLPDTYILYAFPDTLDVAVGGAYYLGDFQWNESNMIVVDGDVYDVDIELPVLQLGFADGYGSVTGVFDFPETPFRASDFYCGPWLREEEGEEYCTGGLSNVGVLLLNATKQRVLGFALTNAQGAFCFRNLPFGTYHLMSDVPRYGRGSCESVSLSPEHPEVEDLHLFINENGRVALRGNESPSSQTLKAYPNPVAEELTLVGLERSEYYEITIANVGGGIIVSRQLAQSDLLGECALSVRDLPSGFYFITVNGEKGTWMTKFVKY